MSKIIGGTPLLFYTDLGICSLISDNKFRREYYSTPHMQNHTRAFYSFARGTPIPKEQAQRNATRRIHRVILRLSRRRWLPL